jgi:hypothetical protein
MRNLCRICFTPESRWLIVKMQLTINKILV